jgi:isopentenyl-diphosphate Delta-isomerase
VSRETELVELVGPDGSAAGVTTVAHAHDWPGLLHRAFSVLLFGPDGRILLQQRAATKTRFAMRWGNACCGHPAPDSDLCKEAAQRLGEELGVGPVALSPVGVYLYRAVDPVTGRVEHEYDHVLSGTVPADLALAPDPAEVAAVRWVEAGDLEMDVVDRSAQYAPWLAGVLATWRTSTETAGGR